MLRPGEGEQQGELERGRGRGGVEIGGKAEPWAGVRLGSSGTQTD